MLTAEESEGGNGSQLQYSCLENFTDRGAWRGCSPWGNKESDVSTHAPMNITVQSTYTRKEGRSDHRAFALAAPSA